MRERKGVILIGPPGSGKSSIALRLMKDKRVTTVETGNLLRDEVEKNTEVGRVIEKNMSSGEVVPTNTVKEVVLQNLKDKKEEYVLFDGFPRVPDQIKVFFELADDLDIELVRVIVLDLSDEIILKRLTGRRICQKCGSIFNIYFDPPTEEDRCTKCDGRLKKRNDDTQEIVNNRLDYYKNNTLKVAEYFLNNYNQKTFELNANNDIETITGEIKDLIFD